MTDYLSLYNKYTLNTKNILSEFLKGEKIVISSVYQRFSVRHNLHTFTWFIVTDDQTGNGQVSNTNDPPYPKNKRGADQQKPIKTEVLKKYI